MFNPMQVLLPLSVSEKTSMMEASTLDMDYGSLRSGFFETIKSTQKSWLGSQKQLFRHLRNEYDDADEYAYKIISSKYETFSNSIFEFLKDKVNDVSKLLYKHTTNSDQQVKIIKAAINHDPVIGRRLYSNGGIGYKTLSLPTEKELAKAFNSFGKAWTNMEPLQASVEMKKLPEWFSSESNICDKMDEEIDYCFKKDKEYSVKEYIDCYTDFKKSIKDYLGDVKQQRHTIKSYIGKIHAQNAADYKAYIKQLQVLNLTKQEKERLISIASHNYSILSQIFMAIINGCTIYTSHLFSLLFNSCANFKNVIQSIYNNVYNEKEGTMHAFLS